MRFLTGSVFAAAALGIGVASMAPVALSQAAAGADAAAGKRVFLRCAACHSIQAGQPNKIGPNLNGIVGRKAGTVAGFRYSAPLSKSGIVWTEANLDRWLTRPSAMVPGTVMAFGGMPNPQERKAVIAYLKKPVP